MSENKKQISEHLIAAIVTFVSIILVCVLLFFCGLMRPYPLPPDYGVEVNLGFMDDGMGENQNVDMTSTTESVEEVVAAEEVKEVEEEVIESKVEETVAINNKPKDVETEVKKPVKTKVVPQEKVEPKEKPVEINQMALYKKRADKKQTSSEGIGAKEGDMGQENGVANASSYSGGNGGSGGISFNLTGRTLVKLVKPEYNSDAQGLVVVRIWVDKLGKVIKVRVGEKGTTTMDAKLWEMAREAALKSKFTPKDSAPEEQVGSIEYKFVRSW